MSDYEDLTSSCGADLSRPGVKNTTDYVEEVTDLESTECEEIAFYQNLLKQMEKSMQEIESVASANNSNQAHPSSNHGNMIGFIRKGAQDLEKFLRMIQEAEKLQKRSLQEIKDQQFCKAFLEANAQCLLSFEQRFSSMSKDLQKSVEKIELTDKTFKSTFKQFKSFIIDQEKRNEKEGSSTEDL